jgi:protein-S-isoprenylcysteine O-methyltransferase Ste14
MNLEAVEPIIRWMGGLLAYTTLGVIFYGVWRGTQRQSGRMVGLAGGWLRSAWFYLASSVLFFSICYFGWKPLPLTVPPSIRAWMLALGSLSYFPGLSFALWGRLTLGKNYFVSTSFGAQLFTGHQLVTSGPFAIVRHPMYTGLILAALGSLLIYPTWTTLLFACFALFITVRARREETALAAEFGEEWQAYCQRVPSFLPWLRR